jgi:hypothetical protein
MTLRRLALAGLSALVAMATPAVAHANQTGTDWVATDNIKFIKTLREAADGVGARVVGHYLYVTSSKGLLIYDISDPVNPVAVGSLTVQVHWENEQVPTNGKILGLSSSDGCTAVTSTTGTPDPTKKADCLSLYDVTDKANPKLITSVWGAGPHTATCVFDCNFIYASDGTITDLRHVTEAGHPAPIIGNWLTGSPATSAHHQNEIAPGIVFTATQPVMLLSLRPEDGGSVVKPKVLATGSNADGRFIHSTQWPGMGSDIFALIGGETNFNPRCGLVGQNGAFMTWDARNWQTTHKLTMIDEYRVANGTYTDGHPPANVLGCSVHWFEEHPTFHNGGLVALAAYESGTRFIQVQANGKMKEQGWFEPIGGSTSAPHWAPDGKTVYAIDYARGIDVLQWTGPLYVPQAAATAASPSPVPPITGLPSTTATAAWHGGVLPALGLVGLLLGGLAALGRSARRRPRS